MLAKGGVSLVVWRWGVGKLRIKGINFAGVLHIELSKLPDERISIARCFTYI